MKKLLILTGFYLASISAISQPASCVTLGQNYYSCGVPSNEFEYMRATSINRGAQIQSNWCWAACVQMVLNYHGLYVSQRDVVTRIYGSPYVNQPANEPQILNALTGWATDTRGRYSSIHAVGGQQYVNDMINLLSNKWPLIVGLSNPQGGIGHAVVLTAIEYSVQYNNQGQVTAYIPRNVVIRDPWPTNPSRQVLSWDEFSRRLILAIRVWVTRL